MTSSYQHLFFDLDHTLWDFETNSQEALLDLYQRYDIEHKLGAEVDQFLKAYYRINDELWVQYRLGKTTKEKLRHDRFQRAFHSFGTLDEKTIAAFELEYMTLAPQKTALLPKAIEVLAELKGRYKMHIITNGFAETQAVKLRCSGLAPFFDVVLCSDVIGINKPEAGIFVKALNAAGANRSNSLMIGDNLVVDILGAKNVGIDQVYFNPKQEVHHERTSDLSVRRGLEVFT
jgi:putative hydrolase of the HAD superfamily